MPKNIPRKKIGSGHIPYKSKISKIPKSVYIPARFKLDNSVIVGAGLGIFTTVALPKDYDLGSYKGRWLTPDEYKKTKNTLYVWEIHDYPDNPNRSPGQKFNEDTTIGYIDAQYKKDSNYLRYVNHPTNKNQENVVAKQIGSEIHYFTTKPVKAGKELMVNYGPGYSKLLLGR